jgi:hypothetical protein
MTLEVLGPSAPPEGAWRLGPWPPPPPGSSSITTTSRARTMTMIPDTFTQRGVPLVSGERGGSAMCVSWVACRWPATRPWASKCGNGYRPASHHRAARARPPRRRSPAGPADQRSAPTWDQAVPSRASTSVSGVAGGAAMGMSSDACAGGARNADESVTARVVHHGRQATRAGTGPKRPARGTSPSPLRRGASSARAIPGGAHGSILGASCHP